MKPLTPQESARYGRHLTLEEIGADGQQRLKATSVLLIGAGGLGSPLALYLTAAGIGRLTVVEFDRIDESNLQRQILYRTAEIGRAKAEVAVERLRELNPFIRIDSVATRFSSANAAELVAKHDIVADGADNFATRFLVNDACVLGGKPLVSASLLAFEGQLSVFNHQGGPCYRCLYPEPPPPGSVPSCAEGGVLGALCGVMGSMQAIEVVKVALGHESLSGRLLHFDAWATNVETFRIRRDPDCPVCGSKPSIRTLAQAVAQCGPLAPEIAPADLHSDPRRYFILDVREAAEVEKGRIEHSHWIPLSELAGRLGEVPSDRDVVVYCRSGGRSRKAAELLLQNGRSALNLAGGVLAWARDVDPSFIVG